MFSQFICLLAYLCEPAMLREGIAVFSYPCEFDAEIKA